MRRPAPKSRLSLMVNTLRDLFEVMDLEKNGEIDQLGFRVGLNYIGVKLPEDTLREVFDQVDSDETGTISYQEFAKFIKSKDQVGEMKKVQEALKRAQNSSLLLRTNMAQQDPIERGPRLGVRKDISNIHVNTLNQSESHNESYEPLQTPPRVRRSTVTSNSSAQSEIDKFEYQPGDKVLLNDDRIGVIKFYGDVDFSAGKWFGIDLDKPFKGSNDGRVQNRRYFRARHPGQGLFVRKGAITRKIADKEYKKVKRASIALRRGENIGDFNPDFSDVLKRMNRAQSEASTEEYTSDVDVRTPGLVRNDPTPLENSNPITSGRARAMSITLFENSSIPPSPYSTGDGLNYEAFTMALRSHGVQMVEDDLKTMFKEIALMGGHKATHITQEDFFKWLRKDSSKWVGFKNYLIGLMQDSLDLDLVSSTSEAPSEESMYNFSEDPFYIDERMDEDDLEKRLRRIFRRFDADADGFLDYKQFRNAWMRINLEGSEDDILNVFQNIDVEDNGTISLDEFMDVVKHQTYQEEYYESESTGGDYVDAHSPKRRLTKDSIGRRESTTWKKTTPLRTPSPTLYEEASCVVDNEEDTTQKERLLQIALEQQKQEILNLKKQMAEMQLASEEHKDIRSPKEHSDSDDVDMSKALRDITAVLSGYDKASEPDGKSDVTTHSNIHDEDSTSIVIHAPSMQKPDAHFYAGGGRIDFWPEFQRMVSVREIFSRMKENNNHQTDENQARLMLAQLRGVTYSEVPPDDTAIPHLCGKSLMAIRGFLQNCPPNFARMMKASVDLPRNPVHKVWNVLGIKTVSGSLTHETAMKHIRTICDQFDQILLRYSLVSNTLELSVRPGINRPQVKAYNRQLKPEGLRLKVLEREDNANWREGQKIEVFDGYEKRWFPGHIRMVYKYYGSRESGNGNWLECEWTDGDGNIWLEIFARYDRNLKELIEYTDDDEESDIVASASSISKKRQVRAKRKRNEEIRIIVDTGAEQFVLKKNPSESFLDVLHDVSAELSTPVEDIQLLSDGQYLNLRHSNRSLQHLGLTDGCLLTIHNIVPQLGAAEVQPSLFSPVIPSHDAVEEGQASLLSPTVLNQVYGSKYKRNLDYFVAESTPTKNLISPYSMESGAQQNFIRSHSKSQGFNANPIPFENKASNYLDNIENTKRLRWKKGTILEIFSVSQQLWCKGKVQKVFQDTEGEWLQISYINPNGSKRQKQIKRFSDQLREYVSKIPADVQVRRSLEIKRIHPFIFGRKETMQTFIDIFDQSLTTYTSLSHVQINKESHSLSVYLQNEISEDALPHVTQLFREALKAFCTTLHSQDPMCSAIKHTLRDFILISLGSTNYNSYHSSSTTDYTLSQPKRRARTQDHFTKRSLDHSALLVSRSAARSATRDRSSSPNRGSKRQPRSVSPFIGHKRLPDRRTTGHSTFTYRRFSDAPRHQLPNTYVNKISRNNNPTNTHNTNSINNNNHNTTNSINNNTYTNSHNFNLKKNNISEHKSSSSGRFSNFEQRISENKAKLTPNKLRLAKTFSKFDADNDGYLNFQEMKQLARVRRKIEYTFADYQQECKNYRVDPEKGFGQSDLYRMNDDLDDPLNLSSDLMNLGTNSSYGEQQNSFDWLRAQQRTDV